MTGAAGQSVIERMARPAPEAEPAETPARTFRLAIARAAMEAAGLPLTVLGVADEVMALDDMLAGLSEGEMLVALGGPGGALGLAAIDPELRAALIERQTMGCLSPDAPEPRPATAADAALSVPLIAAFLADLAGSAGGGIGAWIGSARVGRRFGGATEAALTLPDGAYRLVRLTVDFGVGERQGALALALPPVVEGTADAAPAGTRPDRFGATLLDAPVALTAVLHRLYRTLSEVEAFEVGQVLPLPGVTVSDLRLEAVDGSLAARGRLGQSTGLRAVRIEVPPQREMTEVSVGGPGPEAGPEAPDTPPALPDMPAETGADEAAEPAEG